MIFNGKLINFPITERIKEIRREKRKRKKGRKKRLKKKENKGVSIAHWQHTVFWFQETAIQI